MHALNTVIDRLRRDGIYVTAWLAMRHFRAVVRSFLEDSRRGVKTSGEMDDCELGFTDSDNHAYVPTDYDTFFEAIRHVQLRPWQDVFVDVGSGKGRIVILAAEHEFRRVIGVEYSAALHQQAQQNLHRARNLVCHDIELMHADAREWEIPEDATVFFFFNPFEGAVLETVCDNLRRSVAQHPRKITVIYVRPDKFFERQIRWQEWLERKIDLPCSDGKVTIYESLPGLAGAPFN